MAKNQFVSATVEPKAQFTITPKPVVVPTEVVRQGMDGVWRLWVNNRLIATGEAVVAYCIHLQVEEKKAREAAEVARLEKERADRKAAGLAKAAATRAEKKRMAEEAKAEAQRLIDEAKAEEERRIKSAEAAERRFWKMCASYPVPAMREYQRKETPLPIECVNYEERDYANRPQLIAMPDELLSKKELRKMAALIDRLVMVDGEPFDDPRYCPRVLMLLAQRRAAGVIGVQYK